MVDSSSQVLFTSLSVKEMPSLRLAIWNMGSLCNYNSISHVIPEARAA